MSTIPVLAPEDARRWDDAAVEAGRSLAVLMNNAGRSCTQLILQRYQTQARQGVIVAAGPGNNGGDGWVIAQCLHPLGIPVWVTELKAPPPGIAADARRNAIADGVRVVNPEGPWPEVGLVVDALLGTGAVGAPRGEMQSLLSRLNDLSVPIVAIDGPTGLDLANGLHRSELRANLTITFGGVRRGHLLARDETGSLIVVDIGLGRSADNLPQLIDRRWAASRLAPFVTNAHKGTRGRVVIIGGMIEMAGAVRLSARAAFAAGAGLLHVVAPAETVNLLRTAEPDAQTLEHELSGALSPELIELIERSDAIVIGPGLGRRKDRTAFVLDALHHARRAVIDADALYALRHSIEGLRDLSTHCQVICTPHVGEFRTLFPAHAQEIESAPWEAARDAAHTATVTVLLKGVPTVVADSEGNWLTIAAGNPGMASGGSGDVLAGIIATLLAQGLRPVDAAAVAAQSLGDAGDHAARRFTVRAMRPMDVITALPDVWRSWQRGRSIRSAEFPILWQAPAPERG